MLVAIKDQCKLSLLSFSLKELYFLLDSYIYVYIFSLNLFLCASVCPCICFCRLALDQAESRDLLEETCGGGQQMETGLYPQTQSSKSSLISPKIIP